MQRYRISRILYTIIDIEIDYIYIYICIYIYIYIVVYRIRKIKRRRCEGRRNVGSRVEYYTVLHLTCPIIPRNAHVLNVLSGTLTRYSWKKALMKNTVTDAVFFL